MKVCKMLHIHDGNPKELQNGNRMFVEEYLQAENVLAEYLQDGWEVKHIIQQVDPAINEPGNFTFYKSGVIVYLEKNV